MTLRQYLSWMLATTALCWLGWIAVVETIDPSEGGFLAFFLFYAALCLSLVGTFSVAGLVVRAIFGRHEPITRHATTSFRQSLLLTALLVGSLFLRSRALLNWWNLLLFISTLTAAEFLMISFRPSR
jgi:hypothetical protein